MTEGIKSKFKGIDLHVHTPSSTCYLDEKTEDEYYLIIQKYVERGIKAIAITDHNTIAGYKKICEIIDAYKTKIKILAEYSNNIEIKNEIDKLNEKLECINKLTIFPGVEFEAKPGIHLLFIFNPKIEIDKIDKFLIECGYSTEHQGKEEVTTVNIDVLDVIEKVKSLQAITIAAHVDSNKGIYNHLEGTYRSRVFKSEFLDGISVNNVINIEKIKSLLVDPNYRRDEPLAFIQSSDHHKKDDCGRSITYFDIENINFENLIECFKNPNEKISSTEIPEIKSIINKIANDENTICIATIDHEKIYKAVVAILNNNFGNILLGVTEDHYKNAKGIIISDEDIKKIKNNIFLEITPGKIYYSLRISKIPYGSNYIFNISINNISNKLFFYLNDIYLLDKVKQEVCLGKTSDILSLNNEKNLQRFQAFQKNIDDRISSLTKKVQLLNNSYDQFNISKTILEDSIKISKIVDLNVIKPNNKIDYESKFIHGDFEGDCYYAVEGPPRYVDTYLRCTCPIFERSFRHDDFEKFKNESIIIAPGGISHIILKSEYYICNCILDSPLLKLSIKKEFIELINIKTLLLWLKSSLFIWLSYLHFGNVNIYIPQIYNKIIIPVSIFESKTNSFMNDKIDQILALEQKFLEKHVLLHDSSKLNDELYKSINEEAISHNKCVHSIAKEIDDYFFNLFNIKNDQIDIINNILSLNSILFFK